MIRHRLAVMCTICSMTCSLASPTVIYHLNIVTVLQVSSLLATAVVVRCKWISCSATGALQKQLEHIHCEQYATEM